MHWLEGFFLSFSVPALALAMLPWVRRWEAATGLRTPAPFACAFAIQLALWQSAGMILGFSGALVPAAVVAWIAAVALPGLYLLTRSSEARRAIPLPPISASGFVLVLVSLGFLLVSTVPPWYRDSLAYHLALPREFAMAGGYVRPDDNIFASFPLGWESILAMLHALGPAPDRFPIFNPRLLGAWTTIAAACATSGLARTLGASVRTAPWAGVLFLLVPTVFEFGTSAYVEPWLILLGSLALDGVIRTARGEDRFLLPSAVCAGLAASVKYPGLALVIFLALILLAGGLRRTEEEGRKALRNALRFAVVAVAVGSPFYVRNLVERGNPFFPVALDVFGGEGWDTWRDIAYGITLSHYGMGRSAIDFLLLPWRLFTTKEMHTGFEGSVGPVVGLGIAAAFLILRRRKGLDAQGRRSVAFALAFVLLWSAFWALSVQQVRFYLLTVPPLIALLVSGLEEVPVRLRKTAVALAVLIGGAWLAPAATELGRKQDVVPWLLGDRTERQILTKLLPDSFPPMRELEELVPENGKVWLVWMRGYTYYLRRPYRLDSVFEAYRLEALLDNATDDRAVLERLHADGITHLLVHERFFLVNGNADLRPGRTEKIRATFDRLLKNGLLEEAKRWDDVALYAVRPEAGALPSAHAE